MPANQSKGPAGLGEVERPILQGGRAPAGGPGRSAAPLTLTEDNGSVSGCAAFSSTGAESPEIGKLKHMAAEDLGIACGLPEGSGHRRWAHLFSRLACATALYAGKPITFLTALALVMAWGATGPMFHFSDTWQLVINTSTTIVTFLMVFLIQHTQNRDTMALQLKLAELIIAMRGAKNALAVAEDLSEEDLAALHEEYRRRAEEALGQLQRRTAKKAKPAG